MAAPVRHGGIDSVGSARLDRLVGLGRYWYLGTEHSGRLGLAIVNFVFWVGIGHAGTLISAILFLFRQRWRTSINRFAEAMTIFAVICALIFPSIHVGRIWLLYWVFPIPNQMSMWPNFRSPLLWDVFAVSIYFTCSLLVLVCRADSRSGNAARPCQDPDSQDRTSGYFRSAGAADNASGAIMKRPI